MSFNLTYEDLERAGKIMQASRSPADVGISAEDWERWNAVEWGGPPALGMENVPFELLPGFRVGVACGLCVGIIATKQKLEEEVNGGS